MKTHKPKKHKPGSWGWLLEWCLRDGKETVIATLQKQFEQTQWSAATAWEDPSTHAIARRFDAIAGKQAETLIRLRQMSEDDMLKALQTGRFS